MSPNEAVQFTSEIMHQRAVAEEFAYNTQLIAANHYSKVSKIVLVDVACEPLTDV